MANTNPPNQYFVYLKTTKYGPFKLKPDAVKLAMHYATNTRKPKIYTYDGQFIGQVLRITKKTDRKGESKYTYQIINADGTIGTIVKTTGVSYITNNKRYDSTPNDSAKYRVYNSSSWYGSQGYVDNANTAKKARYLAIQYLSRSNEPYLSVDILKWKNKIGSVFKFNVNGKVRYSYLPKRPSIFDDISTLDTNVLKKYGVKELLLNPSDGEIIGTM